MKLFIALMLICSGDCEYDHKDIHLMYSCRHIGIQLELLDEHDGLFTEISNFKDDLEVSRKLYKEYASYPHLSDLKFLPSEETATKFVDLNSRLESQINKDWYIFPAHMRHTLDSELNYHVRVGIIWQDLVTAYTDKTNEGFEDMPIRVLDRRVSLNNVRNQIGYENYYRGQLPTPISTIRFIQK